MLWTMLSKIFAGVSAVLLVISLVLYSSTLSLENKVTTLKSDVDKLKVEKQVLEDRVSTCQKICRAQETAFKEQQDAIDQMREDTESTVNSIRDKIFTTKGEGKDATQIKNDVSGSLSTDLIRLLEQHCSKVRGETCPSP